MLTHRRLDPEKLAEKLKLRGITGVGSVGSVGSMTAGELDAAGDQVRAMGSAIRTVLSMWSSTMPGGQVEELQEAITPRAAEVDITLKAEDALEEFMAALGEVFPKMPYHKYPRLRAARNYARAVLSDGSPCVPNDLSDCRGCGLYCPHGDENEKPDPDVHSTLVGLVEALGKGLPVLGKAASHSALARAYKAAMALLKELEDEDADQYR